MARKAQVEKKEEATLAEQLSKYAVAPETDSPIVLAVIAAIQAVDNTVLLATADAAVRTDLSTITIVDRDVAGGDFQSVERDGFSVDDIEAAAATYIVDRHFGQQCRDLHFGITAGDRQIVETKAQLARMYAQLPKSKGDAEFERKLAGRIAWLTRMQVQQAFRTQLFNLSKSVYREATGMEWVEPTTGDTDTQKLKVSPAAKALLG